MPTKVQAKVAIDNVVSLVKSDIDILPVGVNVSYGRITFNPNKWYIGLNAEGSAVTANSLLDAITTYLLNARREFAVSGSRGRRGEDELGRNQIVIETTLAIYYIDNF